MGGFPASEFPALPSEIEASSPAPAVNPQPAQVPGEFPALPSEQATSPFPTLPSEGASEDESTLAPGRQRKAQLSEEERAAQRESTSVGSLFSQGFQRGVQSLRAVPESFSAISSDLVGDEAAAIAAAQRAKAIEDEAPEALWELKNVRGLTDFGLWLTERLGENAVNILGAAVTGGAGGIVGALGARGLALSAAGRAAMIRAGAGAGAFASSMPLETSGTMLEQFEATGSPQGATSLVAGTAKGLLELPTMFRLFAPLRATSQGPKHFLTELGKTMRTEGLTELAQEEIDILARKYNDPNYSYFGSPALWRRAEAGVAGAAIGGIVGGPSAYLDTKRSGDAPDDSGQRPGQRDLVQEAGVRVRGVVRDVEPKAEVEPTEPAASAEQFPQLPSEAATQPNRTLRLHPSVDQNAMERAFSETVVAPETGVTGTPAANERGSALDVMPPRGPAANDTFGSMSDAQLEALFRKREEEEADPNSERNIHRRQVEQEFERWEAEQRQYEAERRRAQFQVVEGGPQKIPSAKTMWEGVKDFFDAKEATPENLQYTERELQKYTTASEEEKSRWRENTQYNLNRYRALLRMRQETGGKADQIEYAQLFIKVWERRLQQLQRTDATTLGPWDKGFDLGAWRDANPLRRHSGPVTEVRNMVIEPPAQEWSLEQATSNGPREDAAGVGPLLRAGVPQATVNEMLDMLEAGTERYVILMDDQGNYGNRTYTNTDLEWVVSQLPQSQKPRVKKIHQSMLQPAAITADVFDLPPVDSNRIYVLGDADGSRKMQLMPLYSALVNEAERRLNQSLVNTRRRLHAKLELERKYNMLLKQGLRVVPSRGTSFYYDGMISGEDAEVTSSGRTRATTFLSLFTGELFTPYSMDVERSVHRDGFIAVALDLNRIRKGELSELPYLHKLPAEGQRDYYDNNYYAQGWQFSKELSETEKQDLVYEMVALIQTQRAIPRFAHPFWDEDGVVAFRRLMQKGIYRTPYPFSRNLVTLKEIKKSDLVPGTHAHTQGQTSTSMSDLVFFTPPEQTKVAETTTITNEVFSGKYLPDPDSGDLSGPSQLLVTKLMTMKPAIDALLKAIGISGVRIEVTPPDASDSSTLGDSHPETGIIRVYVHPENYQAGKELDLFSVLMHEIGHTVTFHYYRRLPYEIQKKLQYAYHKNMLVRRAGTDEEAAARLAGFNDPNRIGNAYTNYFTSFVEWMAEQFRRFAGTATEVTTELDQHFKQIATQMESFYRQWEAQFGDKMAKDMTQPDYFFSAVMEYLRNYAVAKEQIKQKARQQTLYELGQDLLNSPVNLQITNVVIAALESLKHIIPHDVLVQLNRELQVRNAPVLPRTPARYIYSQQLNLNLIEIAVGSLGEASERFATKQTRVMVAHELVHAYRRLGIMTDTDFESLYRFAKMEKKDLKPSEKAELRNEVEEWFRARNLPQDKAEMDRKYEEWYKEEVVAVYIDGYANTSQAMADARPILERIIAVIMRVKEALFGAGWHTRDALLRSFFTGEMLARADRRVEDRQVTEFVANIRDRKHRDNLWDKVEKVGNNFVATYYTGGKDGQQAHTANYFWFEQDPRTPKAEPVGVLRAVNRMPKGFDIQWIESERFFLTVPMIQYMEKDLGVQAKPSGSFTADGFKFMQMRFKHLAKYYVRNPENGDYYSPTEIQRRLRVERASLGIMNRRKKDASSAPNAEAAMQYMAELQIAIGKKQKTIDGLMRMWHKVPKDIWEKNSKYLEQMFMLRRNWERDEVQGSLIRHGNAAEENKLMRALSEPQTGPATDAFTAATERDGKLAAMDNDGVVPQVEVRNMRKIIERVTGLETSEETKKYLRQSGITQEADRIGYFTRIYWGLHQLVWRNPHVLGLLDYMQFTELFNQTISRWHARADEVARAWDQKNTKREQIGEYLFWAMEMKYLSPQEEAAKVVRHPTRFEREAEMRRLGLSPDDRALVTQIEKEFAQFLNEVEQTSIENIRATVSNPIQASQAIMEVQAEMNKLRAKPYFPITRFGRYTVTVRDGSNTRIVNHFEAFDTFKERDDAVEKLAAQFPGDEITVGRVPEEMFEFMGLPAPLIRAIRENMPGLTPHQQAWLEDFERINLPDRSFRKRWKPAIGTPGHSMDAFRVYAHYFMHGSRYLARLKYGRSMSQAIAVTRGTIDTLPNSTKRRMIVDYMTKHYNYIMEGAKDWSRFKAFVSLWQLGFSPAAAAMNFTQTPVVSWPFLAGTFGNSKGTSGLLAAMRDLTKSRLQNPGGTGKFYEAWTEMTQQGRIDIGQAAELGSYAQGKNLLSLLAGTKRQKFYRNVSYVGMWMFQKAEEVNRKVMFKAAWELAMKNPGTRRLQEIQGTAMTAGPSLGYSREIADLRARLGFSMQEAVAFIFAKEAIDQTQGIYAPYSRPAFMRNPLASTVLIFYQFVQMMTYVYRYNPGTVQLMLISLALYGLLGLPGAEDLNEMVRFAAQKIFGTDWDPKLEARKYAREITRGTVFDEVGPDLLLHGVSRYGFGLGLLPEGWALGKFDASANGSLGKLVPGAYEALHGMNVKNKPDQYVSDLMQRLSGAGFGFFFNFLQFANENPGSVDSKKWESMLPRSARAAAKAWRQYSDEGETTRSGARIVRFDVQDPEDLAALGFQAIGFASTKVNATWELLREQRDLLQLYQAERAQLYGQMARAIQSTDQQAIRDVGLAIREYNEGVKQLDPSMQISASQVIQSMRNRERAKQLQENLLPNQRAAIPVARRLQDMFPNVKAERVQVQRPQPIE